MARTLNIAPAHLTDLETGRRTPSEELLVRMAEAYGMPQPTLRAGWSKPDLVVGEIAAENPVNAEKVPEFLRTARDLSPQQWDKLIRQARHMRSKREGDQE